MNDISGAPTYTDARPTTQRPSTSRRRQPRVDDGLLLLVAALWGSSYLAARNAAEGGSVALVLAVRFGAAVVVLLALAAARRRRRADRKPVSLAASLRANVLPGTALTAVFLLETYGVVRTSPAHAGVVISVFVVLTPLAETVLQRVPLPRGLLGAGALSVAGVALLARAGGSSTWRGDLLVLSAAVARAGHLSLTARSSGHRQPDPLADSTIQLALVATLTAALALLVPATRHGGFPADTGGWASLGYLTLGCTVLPFLVQNRALATIRPSQVGLLLGTEPVFAAVLGAFLGAPLGPAGWAGTALVLIAVAWGRFLTAGAPARIKACRPAAGRFPDRWTDLG